MGHYYPPDALEADLIERTPLPKWRAGTLAQTNWTASALVQPIFRSCMKPALYLGPRARMLKVDALAAAIFAAWRPPVDIAARVSPRP